MLNWAIHFRSLLETLHFSWWTRWRTKWNEKMCKAPAIISEEKGQNKFDAKLWVCYPQRRLLDVHVYGLGRSVDVSKQQKLNKRFLCFSNFFFCWWYWTTSCDYDAFSRPIHQRCAPDRAFKQTLCNSEQQQQRDVVIDNNNNNNDRRASRREWIIHIWSLQICVRFQLTEYKCFISFDRGIAVLMDFCEWNHLKFETDNVDELIRCYPPSFEYYWRLKQRMIIEWREAIRYSNKGNSSSHL